MTKQLTEEQMHSLEADCVEWQKHAAHLHSSGMRVLEAAPDLIQALRSLRGERDAEKARADEAETEVRRYREMLTLPDALLLQHFDGGATAEVAPTKVGELVARADEAEGALCDIDSEVPRLYECYDGTDEVDEDRPVPLYDRVVALRERAEAAEARVDELKAEARRFYKADGTFDELESAEAVVERRKAAAKRLAELETKARTAEIERDRAQEERDALREERADLRARLDSHADAMIELAASKVEVVQAEPGGWRPIETKPEDRTLVVAYLRKADCYDLVNWSESSGLWMQDEVSGWRDDQLVAWAPLPLPPPPSVEEPPAGAEGGEASHAE